MNEYSRSMVHRLVASQTRAAAADVHDDDRLEDVGLQPMDLVMIVLRLEKFDRGQGDFPLDALARAETVGDLVVLVDAWLRRGTLRRTGIPALQGLR